MSPAGREPEKSFPEAQIIWDREILLCRERRLGFPWGAVMKIRVLEEVEFQAEIGAIWEKKRREAISPPSFYFKNLYLLCEKIDRQIAVNFNSIYFHI